MFGAILGDLIGQPYEFANIKTKDFPLISPQNTYTDDTVMTLAVADAIMRTGVDASDEDLKGAFVESMQVLGRRHPDAGYGGRFRQWLRAGSPAPYNSFGNGAAMRVSSIAWFYPGDLERAEHVAGLSAEVSHNHPEGVKAARATTAIIWMANEGRSKSEIREYVEAKYYRLDKTCDQIRPDYKFDVSSQGTMPAAIAAFYEGTSFEDVVRLGISLGGDSDTIGAISGGMAEAYYGVPHYLKEICLRKMTRDMARILDEFQMYIKERDLRC